jgi:hypothetical protein
VGPVLADAERISKANEFRAFCIGWLMIQVVQLLNDIVDLFRYCI